jgi:aminoglycoside/choline kinase family phosphotransferase
MQLFPDWFVRELLGHEAVAPVTALLENMFVLLEESALQQPQVLVHRDYHVRNLMVSDPSPGVIDFQDAIWGPITYDLVSLLRDCYVRRPPSSLDQQLEQYRQALLRAGLLTVDDAEQFRKWFDWMGLQRHIKVLGIFARLAFRDGKQQYLDDLPLVIRYTLEVASRYEEFADFCQWFETKALPQITEKPWYRDWQVAGDEHAELFDA